MVLAMLAVASPIKQKSGVAINQNGNQTKIEYTNEIEARKNKSKHRGHHNNIIKGGKITYYSGNQLLRPACENAPTPTDESMIAAVSLTDPIAKCGDTVWIKHGNVKVPVTVVDYCAACTFNWFDTTKAVFQRFADLSAGVINDVTFEIESN